MHQPGRFFLPGPTEVAPEVLAAQAKPMIGHRGPAIEALLDRIGENLKPVFCTEERVLVSTSSATGLMEAGARNVPEGRVLSLVNGAFSARFAEIARACGHQVDELEVPWGQVHDLDRVASALGRARYDALTVTHSETSTGALQDIEGLSGLTRDGVLLLVDSVTGVAGAEMRPDEWGIEYVLTGSQKAMALPPGLSFAVASPDMLSAGARAPHRGYYFDLPRMHARLKASQTHSTPAVSLLYALDTQLERILSEGVEERWERHGAMRDTTVGWVESRGASFGLGMLAPAGARSPTVSCITLPERLNGPEVVGRMEEAGWVIGNGYGKLRETAIRVGHMGDHGLQALEALLDALDTVLSTSLS